MVRKGIVMAKYALNHGAVASWEGHFSKFIDFAIISCCGWLSYVAYFSSFDIAEERYSWAILVGMVLAAFLFPLFGLYASWKGQNVMNILYNIFVAYLSWGISIIIVLFFFRLSDKFPRGWLIYWGGGALFTTMTTRIIGFWLYKKILLKNKYRVVLVGDKKYCQSVEKTITRDKSSEFFVSRVLVNDSNNEDLPEKWQSYRTEKDINIGEEEELWICLPISKGNDVISIVNALDKKTINIRFMPGFKELRLINHKVSIFSGVSLLDISCSPMTTSKRFIKRVEDVILSSIILILISPLLVIITIGVKISSVGPIFYRQKRVSWNNNIFNMLKFRSMAVNSEGKKVEWGNATNKKVTSFGKFIRKTSLDELPQFLNVLKGDMSIVGPRPERDIFVEKFGEEIPGYMQKHMVKAGITGWAQIHGLRGDTSLEKRIEYDLWYIENWSFWLDMKIIFMTFFKVLFDRNAE